MDRDSNTISASASRGIELFNSSHYWEAHEAWEAGWTKLPQPLKAHLQGLIMGCAAFIHLEKSRFSPAIAVAKRCLELSLQAEGERRSGAEVMIKSFWPFWIEVPGLTRLMQEIIGFERSQESPPSGLIPQIECAKILNQAKTLKAKLVNFSEKKVL